MPSKVDEEIRGVHANHMLLTLLNDTIGREVFVETRDGRKFEGIFAGCNADFQIGLQLAHQIPPEGHRQQLLPRQSDIMEKLQFDAPDIVCMSVVMNEEKRIRGFATDREYQANGQPSESIDISAELEIWEGDDDEEYDLENDSQPAKGGKGAGLRNGGGRGWSANEMFEANSALGVKSTFEDNLSQYTTASVEEDSKAREKADRIAKEIESSMASKIHARMENDDEERNLAEQTPEFAVQYVVPSNHRNKNTSGRNSYSGNPRSGGGNASTGSNRSGAPSGGRRSDGIGSGGRGGRGGSYGSGGGTSRSFTNSSMGHGGKMSGSGSGSGGYGTSGGRYQPPPERQSAQSVHNEFSQWEMRRGEASGAGAAGGVGTASARRTDSLGDGGQGSAAKVYESSHRGVHHGAQHSSLSRPADEHRSSTAHHAASSADGGGSQSASGSGARISQARGPSPAAARGGRQAERQAERMKDLREFQNNFNNTFQPTSQPPAHSSADEQSGRGPVTSTTPAAATKPVSAWNKGPPPSIRSSSSSAQPTQIVNTSPKEPTPAESASHTATGSEQPQQQQAQKSKGTVSSTRTTPAPPATNVPQQGASSSASTETSSSSTITEGAGHRVHSANSSEPASPAQVVHASVGPQTPSTPAMPPPQKVIVGSGSAAETPALSNTGSSSSIAPVDPTPSTAASSNDTVNTTVGSTVSSGKKFEFNPDAQPFTPRSATTHTPTPQTTPAPQPLIGSQTTPMPMQTISLNTPQGLPVAQGIQPGGMMATPQMFPYGASAGVFGTMPVYYGTPQAVMQAGPQLTQTVSASPASASVTGGPIVAGATGMSTPRGAQGNVATSVGRRPQQQIVQGGVYVPSQAAMPYPQQMIPQYQMPFYPANPYQQLSMGSANVPPPSVPPPTSSTVAIAGGPPQSIHVIPAHAQHPQAAAAYARQVYQSGQPTMNYVVAATPRYAQQHQGMEYAATGAQQQSQQPSSATSSNGNSSNGHNSQPATPGPQPVASPAQMAYPSSGTPQSPHQLIMQAQSAAGPPHHQQHLYVHSAPFPFGMPAGSAPSYMVYSPMQPHPTLMQIPSVATAQMNMAQQHSQLHHQQHLAMEHYPGSGDQSGGHQLSQGMQPQCSVASQPYMTSDQSYGYVHAQQTIYHQQQQAVNAAIVRQNSLGGAVAVPSPAQQAFQQGTIPQSMSQPNSLNQSIGNSN